MGEWLGLACQQDVFLVVDVQNDFCQGGALAVANADAVVSVINQMMEDWPHVILTQDWHPPGHYSFASAHANKSPFDVIETLWGEQTLWPDHCIQGTKGAALHPELDTCRAELLVRKGFRKDLDSYSAFFENDRITPTGLTGYLRERGLNRVVLGGLATDVCVASSALDARRQGFDVLVLLAACRAVDQEGSLHRALTRMRDAGVVLVGQSV
jgi:nicotinamidase/pyrazinamidase